SSTCQPARSSTCGRPGWTSNPSHHGALREMSGYLAKRLLGALPTLVGVSFLSFLFIRLIPGDAIAARLGTSTALAPEQLASLRAYFGLDQPIPVQYWNWLVSLLHGDAGYSIRTGRPVFVEIAQRLPPPGGGPPPRGARRHGGAHRRGGRDRDRDRRAARARLGAPSEIAPRSRRACRRAHRVVDAE